MTDQIVAITVTDEQQAWLSEAFEIEGGYVALEPDEQILMNVWGALPAEGNNDD